MKIPGFRKVSTRFTDFPGPLSPLFGHTNLKIFVQHEVRYTQHTFYFNFDITPARKQSLNNNRFNGTKYVYIGIYSPSALFHSNTMRSRRIRHVDMVVIARPAENRLDVILIRQEINFQTSASLSSIITYPWVQSVCFYFI